MSRTTRKRWQFDHVSDEVRLVTGREQTCRPGCRVCGKDAKRAHRRRLRHGERGAIAFDARA